MQAVDGLSINALFAITSRKVSEKSLKQIANGKNFLKRLKKHPIPYTFKVPFSRHLNLKLAKKQILRA